ncbi:nephrocystin-4-like [Centruroides sculpturatus]|uniref:nephrocystin-4-like n=1 Tax=Centruroides sculpturatus TaxID=218467 RepID=UPI000C6DEB63|nr:nephrocystin-4-like [Centruroides sculpturatus]
METRRELKFKRLIFNDKNKKKIEQSEDVAVAVNLLFIDGLPFQSNQVEFCQVHGTLFDIQENQFIGRTCTILNTSDIKKRKLNIEKNIYFYTSNEEKLILIIELSVQKKDTKYTESVGWGILQPLQFMKKSTDTSLKRLSLLHGSPRILLVIGNPFELKDGHALPSKLQSTEVVYTVHPHYALLKVNHLFPENTLLCDSDVIPGLISTHDDLQIKDVLKKPKLQKCTTCVLDHIFIKISPSIVDFENELITKVKEDKTSEELSSTDIAVAERRLIVGVHNSWNYIQEKEVHHLVIGSMKHYSNSSLSKIASSKSKKDGDEMVLLLRNRVKLNIPEDFNIFLVFFLEYVLSFVTTPKDRKTTTFPVLLNWCKWFPFVEKVSTDITLNLNFGPAENVEEKLLYRTKNIQMSFNFSTLIGKKKGLIPLKNEESNQEFEKLVSPSKSFNEPEQNETDSASSVIENFPKHQSFLKETELTEVAIINGFQLPVIPVIKQQSSGAKFVSRATYSLLQAVGFPPIRDQQGKLPHMVDSLNSTDFEKEIQDPYICNDIILQFLAYSCHLDSKRFFPHVLFFTFQFYRFPPIQTERLLLENQDNINYNKPYILYCFQSGGNKKTNIPGYHVRYHIDPAYLTPGERKEFLNYIYSHWLHIDVWDGNSLLYVGTASLQLKCLCRQGREAVQSMLELDIWQENYVDECTNRVNNEKKLQGNLYLRIANIGSPSSITSLKKIHDLSSTNLLPIVTPQPVNKHEYKACLVTKARPIVELNQEISSFLVSHFDDLYLENVIGLSEEKRRKLARMEAVRKAIEENGNICKMDILWRMDYSFNIQNLPKPEIDLVHIFQEYDTSNILNNNIIISPFLRAKFVSRATYSLLQAVGFPPIRDQQRKLPHMVDSLNSTDFEKEIQDPYICNDIILQFLAYSCHLDSKRFFPHVLFFTFQFYRFPPIQTERLLLENQDNINYNKPYILYCFQSGENKKTNIPGYHVRYHIDPAYLTPGERKEFLNYIYSHWLHIDVWDGNSLLYVGTASLQLKCLCRQGREAVQSMLELDIWQENYVDECTNRVNNEKKLQGNLYLRIANIGSPSSITSLKKIHDLSSTNLLPIVTPQPVNKHEYKACLVTKARPIVELNQEISSFLVSHFDDLYLENVIGLSEEKRRKLARMEAVRKAIEENGNICKMNKQKIFTDRVKDFHTIDAYRENHKHENILSILQKSITVETTIHPMLGSTYFFEFELTNPYPREHRIFIECQHPSLNVVFCTDEWKHFRQLWKIEEFVEENFFSQSNFQKGTMPQLFVRPYEKVRIPFKYLSLNNIAKCESWKATSGHIFTAEMLTKYPLSDYFKPFTIKVNFKTEDAKLIYILNINIQPVPPNIQQSFYFLVSENAFLNRRIRISKRIITLINRKHFSQINILCSDNNVICGVQRSENIKDQIDIYFKAACGEAGIERRFYLFLYDNPFMSKPIHTWLIETLTVQRIDISCPMGQCVQSSVVLKGADETHLVQCFTSHPTELQLFPNGYFTLSANTFQELQLIAKSDLPGTKKIYVNLVNMEFYSLMKTWLIVLMCQRPTITKSYQVQLSITSQDIAIKRITYSNQYNYPKTYLVSSSHPQLLQLAEQKFSIEPRKNYSLGLLFFPQHKPMSEEIFIFVNNLEGKNEETFSIRMIVS